MTEYNLVCPTVRKKSGFTLIELLVVIAIIAILAAILFPVFAQAREKARQATCISNMKQIGIATIGYSQDHDEVLPIPGYDSPIQVSYDVALNPYMGFKVTNGGNQPGLVWTCPNDNELRSNNNQRVGRSYSLVTARINPCGAPGCTGPEVINATQVAGYVGAGGKHFGTGGVVGRALAEIPAPANTFYMAETRNLDDNQGTPYGGQVFYPLWSAAVQSSYPWALSAQNWAPKVNGGPKAIIEPSHSGGWNYLYCDGHVKWSKPEATLGRNPQTGAPNTNTAQPRGPWTVWDGDD